MAATIAQELDAVEQPFEGAQLLRDHRSHRASRSGCRLLELAAAPPPYMNSGAARGRDHPERRRLRRGGAPQAFFLRGFFSLGGRLAA